MFVKFFAWKDAHKAPMETQKLPTSHKIPPKSSARTPSTAIRRKKAARKSLAANAAQCFPSLLSCRIFAMIFYFSLFFLSFVNF